MGNCEYEVKQQERCSKFKKIEIAEADEKRWHRIVTYRHCISIKNIKEENKPLWRVTGIKDLTAHQDYVPGATLLVYRISLRAIRSIILPKLPWKPIAFH